MRRTLKAAIALLGRAASLDRCLARLHERRQDDNLQRY